MTEDQIVTRILDAVTADPSVIPSLAQSIVRNDPTDLRSLLAGSGVALTEEEAAAVLALAQRSSVGSANTSTNTTTWTGT